MNEQMPMGLTPEQLKAMQDKEKAKEDAWLAQYIEENPDKFKEIAAEDRRECGPEIAEFETMLYVFEKEYSLEILNAITTSEEAFNHPIREPANLALKPIVAKFNSIKDETDISPEKLNELNMRRKKLVNAVGFINGGEFDKNIQRKVNGGKVEHNR
ncbi:MAG: hypothetical protein COX29_02060 [Candidatus Moranbacteria bacterium CG23_combo_of_CG06-09_8_20_14_all_35_22]|nr:MAG: hypothetical protein COX29_02060 [Candidatus Moranbacteria bacterium CG23_combo_of_CG06-09_8_20_14_all_35_22]